jgi:hypothetical protein
MAPAAKVLPVEISVSEKNAPVAPVIIAAEAATIIMRPKSMRGLNNIRVM